MHNKVMAQAVALVLTGLVASAAIAADKKTAQPAQPEQVSGGSMQVAFFDPITKKMRAPTAEEAAAFAKANELKRQSQAVLPNTSGRPRNEAESLRTLRTVHLDNGITVEVIDTPESEMSTLVGKVGADGHMIIKHGNADGHVASTEVTQ